MYFVRGSARFCVLLTWYDFISTPLSFISWKFAIVCFTLLFVKTHFGRLRVESCFRADSESPHKLIVSTEGKSLTRDFASSEL